MSYTVNVEQRIQHNLLLQTLNNHQNSPQVCLGFVANDHECGRHHHHHLTCEPVPPRTKLLLKCPVCLQIVFCAVAVYSRNQIIGT